jgi:hypothetical protein
MHPTRDTPDFMLRESLRAAGVAGRYALCGRFSLNQAFSASYLPM